MIAVLPMYDWPAIRPATDAFWGEVVRHLGAHGIAAPSTLTRPRNVAAAWRDPNLLLGQACGMPYVAGACGGAGVVARPDYGLEDAAGGLYCSVIVVRAGEAHQRGPEAVLEQSGRRAAVNEWGSYSGHVALRAYLAELRETAAGPFFSAAVVSGSHADSARLVARGGADLAALDGVVWALLQEYEPKTAARLAVLDRTNCAPSLPFVAAPRFAAHGGDLAAALDAAAVANAPVAGLPRRVAPASDDDYEPIRLAARLAGRETFAPGAPAVPQI